MWQPACRLTIDNFDEYEEILAEGEHHRGLSLVPEGFQHFVLVKARVGQQGVGGKVGRHQRLPSPFFRGGAVAALAPRAYSVREDDLLGLAPRLIPVLEHAHRHHH